MSISMLCHIYTRQRQKRGQEKRKTKKCTMLRRGEGGVKRNHGATFTHPRRCIRSHASQLLIPLHPARLRIRRLPTQLLSHLPHKWYVTTMAYLLYTKYNTTTVIDENFPQPMDALRPYRHFWTAVPVRDVVTLPFDLRTRPVGHPLASARAILNV